MTNSIDRRSFVETWGIGTATYLAGFSATSKGYAANETINVGLLGCGGRCRHLLGALKKIEGVRVAAISDVWDESIAQTRPHADKDALVTKEFERVLERKDIDAVMIASPDHWHVPMTVAACKAQKDVYVEKPLTHDLSEGEAVINAQNENRRIVQVGMQQRSMPQFIEAREIIKSGRLGKVHKVHLTWNRNAPRAQRVKYNIDPKTVDWTRFVGAARKQEFDEYRFRNWRWFWDFGGGIFTDLMVHWIDVVNMCLDLDHPAVAASIGDHFQSEGLWETPDTVQTLLQFPDKEVQVYFEGTFFNARNAAMIEFMGTEATLYADRGRYEIHPEPGRGKVETKILGTRPRGADFDTSPDGELLHLSNWIECVRSRKKPNAPAEAGVAAVTGAHLANRSLRTGKIAHWDSSSGG